MLLRLSLALSLLALLVLAGLQYHWIGQITVAERQRLERNAVESSRRFAEDLGAEIRGVVAVMEPQPGAAVDAEAVAERYRAWSADAAFPGLLKSIYIARSPADVVQLNPVSESFEPAVWPEHLSAMADFLVARGRSPAEIPPDVLLLRSTPRFAGPRPEGRSLRGGGFPDAPRGSGTPAVPPEAFNGERSSADDEGVWLLAELNTEVLASTVLPTLAARNFPESEERNYRVAITASRRDAPPQVFFTSGGEWSAEDLNSPDFDLDLFGAQRRGGGGGPGGPPPRGGGPRGGERGERGGERGARGQRGEIRGLNAGFLGQRWHLFVKHPAGSLDTASSHFRNRNLAISFGVLVILAIGAGAISISGSRAQRLGNLQMQFAAGISHELRTPLAVIQSAAHNLGAGVVKDREGIEEYAALVQTEARRLGDMVDQVLTYTETQSGRKRYDLAPVDLTDIADASIRNMSTVLREGSAHVENALNPDLPPVLADAPALMRCLQNLISNAVKYGNAREAGAIRIDGTFVATADGAGRVELHVTDHGPGVPQADVRHLFEAFHRGSNASTNTPGNGLGLHLVQRMMAAQHGTVTYTPAQGGGARFTLSLPVARPS